MKYERKHEVGGYELTIKDAPGSNRLWVDVRHPLRRDFRLRWNEWNWNFSELGRCRLSDDEGRPWPVLDLCAQLSRRDLLPSGELYSPAAKQFLAALAVAARVKFAELEKRDGELSEEEQLELFRKLRRQSVGVAKSAEDGDGPRTDVPLPRSAETGEVVT